MVGNGELHAPSLGSRLHSSSIQSNTSSRLHSPGTEINYGDLSFKQKIGRGSFGNVFKAVWIDEIVAVKCVTNMSILNKKRNDNITNTETSMDSMFESEQTRAKKSLFSEIIAASKIEYHPNVVKIFGYVRKPQICLVMSYCENGSVENYVYSKKRIERNLTPVIVPLVEKLIIIKKACNGLKFLHESGIIHRDIAARNILIGKFNNEDNEGRMRITNETEIKICDFGMSRSYDGDISEAVSQQNDKSIDDFGPIRWMAPESIENRVFSLKSDVWMFGMTIWEVLHQEMPFVDMTVINVAMVCLICFVCCFFVHVVLFVL